MRLTAHAPVVTVGGPVAHRWADPLSWTKWRLTGRQDPRSLRIKPSLQGRMSARRAENRSQFKAPWMSKEPWGLLRHRMAPTARQNACSKNRGLQRYRARGRFHKNPPPPGTLQYAYTWDPTVVLDGGKFLMSEVLLYAVWQGRGDGGRESTFLIL